MQRIVEQQSARRHFKLCVGHGRLKEIDMAAEEAGEMEGVATPCEENTCPRAPAETAQTLNPLRCACEQVFEPSPSPDLRQTPDSCVAPGLSDSYFLKL